MKFTYTHGYIYTYCMYMYNNMTTKHNKIKIHIYEYYIECAYIVYCINLCMYIVT